MMDQNVLIHVEDSDKFKNFPRYKTNCLAYFFRWTEKMQSLCPLIHSFGSIFQKLGQAKIF